MLRCPHSSSVADGAGSAAALDVVAAGRTGAALRAVVRAAAVPAAPARFCAAAYFASRIARRLSILLIAASPDDPSPRDRHRRRATGPTDGRSRGDTPQRRRGGGVGPVARVVARPPHRAPVGAGCEGVHRGPGLAVAPAG